MSSNRVFLSVALLSFASRQEIAPSSGIPRAVASALVWGDFDHDGLKDVYDLSEGRLLRNNGDGSFEDRTVLAGLSGVLASRSAAWGDYDRDGWPDLYVSSSLGGGKLLRNQQDGSFEDVTRDAGLASGSDAHDASWLDYDTDGYLDLMLKGTSGAWLLHNRRDATFEVVPLASGLPRGTSVANDAAKIDAKGPILLSHEHDQKRTEPTPTRVDRLERAPVASASISSGSPHSSFAREASGSSATESSGTEKVIAPTSEVVPSGESVLSDEQFGLSPDYTSTSLHLDVVSGPDRGWTVRPSLPLDVTALAATTLDGKVYTLGGWCEDGFFLHPYVWEYDPASYSWSAKPPMPTPRWFHAAAAVNGRIYALGGAYPVMATVEEFDPVSFTWATRTPMPTARWALAAAVAGGKIYAIGGVDSSSQESAAVEEYDPVSNTWASKAPMLGGGSYGLAAAVVDEKIYVVGGRWSSLHLQSCHVYDPRSNTWAIKASMPTGRAWLAAVAINQKIYAIGGSDGIDQDLGIVEEYTPETNTWSTKRAMVHGRRELAAVACNGKIYAAGGWRDGADWADFEEYDPGLQTFFFHRKN